MERNLTISVGGSRKATAWAQTQTTWAELVKRLETPVRGTESHAAYMRMPKAQQDNLKDIGGFVGGTLRGGRRKAANVTGRDLVTLDMDAIPAGGTEAVEAAVSALGCASCIYSTRKHEPGKPRLRIVLPLSRTVTSEEYEPIARRLAEWLGIEQCDPTTFESWRLMYWPSASADSDYAYEVNSGPWIDADDLLGGYKDWRNVAEWPQVPGQAAEIKRTAAKQEDPESKGGVVGAFCRAYSIQRVMDELIPGAYEPTDDPDRYTYTGGSTSGGAILYEGKWLYSHHATDPCSGRLVNAWDLARLHLYGDKDGNASETTPVNKLPSYKAMAERAVQMPEVKRLLMEQNQAQISADFGTADPDNDWRVSLACNARGEVLGTLDNLKIIFANDPSLQCIGRDVFQQRSLVWGPLPWDKRTGERDWTDSDDTGAAWYAEAAYGIKDLRRIKMAADAAMAGREHDCLREYLEGLTWDGVPRVDRLLIDGLLADDTPYTRAVTRKTLVAAVARALEPGCKFDNVLSLIGGQGIGKSLFGQILGGAWYTDNVQSFTGKEAAEQLRGAWIVEIPEVDRFSARYEAAAVKQFITRQDDIYREAYARRTMPHPRRCIFIASTNEGGFLTDTTGNRRWWVVHCHGTPEHWQAHMPKLKRDRDQIWAEAVALWRLGEPLTLDAELYAEAVQAQAGALVDDPWLGLIEEFVSRKLPTDWAVRNLDDRRAWWGNREDFKAAEDGLAERRYICVAEVWCEMLLKDRGSLDGRTSRRIAGLLRRLPGWEFVGARKTLYGMQKCFYRATTIPALTNIQNTNHTIQPQNTQNTEPFSD